MSLFTKINGILGCNVGPAQRMDDAINKYFKKPSKELEEEILNLMEEQNNAVIALMKIGILANNKTKSLEEIRKKLIQKLRDKNLSEKFFEQVRQKYYDLTFYFD